MVTQAQAEGTRDKPRERMPLMDAARRVLLAGIGAMALAQDEIEDFVDRLVERGELAEKEGRQLVEELRTKRRKFATDEIARRVEESLERMDIPTKADVEALSQKIAALTKKIEELKKSQG